MHSTTALYIAKSHQHDLEVEAANARLAASVRKHESDGRRPTRWSSRLQRLVPRFRRGPVAGTATA